MADVNLSLDLLNEVRESTSHRVKRFGFGDGYEQVAADGANTRMTKYDVITRPPVYSRLVRTKSQSRQGY